MHDVNSAMKLLVLAGGFGTRLKAAIADVPKALAPIGNVSFLQLQIEHWIDQGIRDFTFLLHHQAEKIIAFLQTAQNNGLLKNAQVDWVVEPTPMDTGGAVAHVVKELELEGDFLLTNADTWLGHGIREMIQSVAPTMAVVNLPNVSRYGQVHFDQKNVVTTFSEKNSNGSAGWINAGLCHLSADLFNDWDGQPFSLERDLFTRLVKNQNLKAVALRTDFIDIGVPDDYHRFCDWAAAGRQTPLCN